MRKLGANVDYEAERQAAVVKAWRKALGEAACGTPVQEIARRAMNMPSERFWVSEERAAIIVAALLKGKNPLQTMRMSKRRMFGEICRRVMELQKEDPQASIRDLVSRVIYEPAPEFYLEGLTALDIIYKRKRA